MAAACVNVKSKTHTADRSVLQGFCTSSVRIDQANSVRIEDEIARRGGLGLKRFGRELIGPCPNCGGDDRFGVNLVKQVFNCRGCGAAGDVIAFVMLLDRVGFNDAVKTLAGDIARKPIAAVITKKPPDTGDDSHENRERAFNIWREAGPSHNTLVKLYLNNRGIRDIPGPHVLRFHPHCPFGPGLRVPAMVALFTGIISHKPQAIHRTPLTADGKKAGKPLTLAPTGGAVIRLDRDEDVGHGLHLGEGIETTLAGRQRYNFRPAWAAGSAGTIANFPVLSGIEALTLMVDNDVTEHGEPGAGPRAATECWNRWTAVGREIRAYTASELGCDIADIVEAERTNNE
jgi:putative DNA primase/helicase